MSSDRMEDRDATQEAQARNSLPLTRVGSPEFVAKAVQEWITAVGAKTAYIVPGSP